MTVTDVEFATDGIVAAAAQEVHGMAEAFDATDDRIIGTGYEKDGVRGQ